MVRYGLTCRTIEALKGHWVNNNSINTITPVTVKGFYGADGASIQKQTLFSPGLLTFILLDFRILSGSDIIMKS